VPSARPEPKVAGRGKRQQLIVDTGPLIAWFDANDTHHARVCAFFDTFDGELFSTWPVLTEVCHLLPEHLVAAFLRWAGLGAVTVVEVPSSALVGLAERMDKYADLPMDLADATLIWLAENRGLLDVLTIDSRDFGVYRTAQGQALRNVLFGAPPAGPARRRR
jgi:uncharacterized protein